MIREIISKNTEYTLNEYYYSILSLGFKTRLDLFLENYYRAFPFTQSQTIAYDRLPYAIKGPLFFEWKFRMQSLSMFRSLGIELAGKKILEAGPWNSWLSHHLKQQNNLLVCVDYFTDECNGLSSKKNYSNNQWISIQCDLENPDFFSVKFDLIILNHNLQFFSDPLKTLEKYKQLLNPGGKIVCLGLPVFKNPIEKAKAVRDFKEKNLRENNFDIFLNPTKAYLDKKDSEEIKKMGFRLIPYKGFGLRNFYSQLISSKPFYCMAVLD